ncbi:MAG: hypothetical protein ACYTBJ_11380 [Planctomycetota bacterium]|jgi:hypothetical protein
MSEKKAAPFKGREPMSKYELHTTFFQYAILGFIIYALVMFTFMTEAFQKLAG